MNAHLVESTRVLPNELEFVVFSAAPEINPSKQSGHKLMPMTINGIGTTYFGRKNIREYVGMCEQCQSHGKLTDYETGHFFSIIFIPVIPLGRRQIVAECAACNRHRAMPLKQWQTLREETLNAGLADLGENMESAERALKLIYDMTVFNQLAEANELAVVCAKQYENDFDVMIQLGSWYEQMGKEVETDKCFSRAIEIDPKHPHSQRIQAIQAIDSQTPQLAAQFLDSMRPGSSAYDPSLFLLFANALQEADLHEQALQEYQQLIKQAPELGADKVFRKRVKLSEKIQGTPVTMLPKAGLFG